MHVLRLILPVLLLALPALPVLAQEPDLGTAAQIENGRVVYDRNCAQCHGDDGAGDGYAAAYLLPVPRDFTSGVFKFRTTQSGELPTTADLVRSIREGMPYTSMPAWKGILSEGEMRDLAYYVKTFNDDFAGPYGVPEPAVLPDAPGFDEDRVARGLEVFAENQCADCHGQAGRGNGDSAPTLEDTWGNPIRPADLTKRWTFRNGQARADIYRTFTTGLDGSPMPSYDLSEEDGWALVDYVWSLSESEPDYATVVVSHLSDTPVGLDAGPDLFADAEPAYFPVVGQIIEPGRSFDPGVNGLTVRAVHDAEHIAFQLSWHDMAADRAGRNHPTLEAPRFDPAAPFAVREGTFSDAVAIQLPAEVTPGVEKPYFMFGDKKRAVDLWFADLATGEAEHLVGRGSRDITAGTRPPETSAAYDDGVWTVTMVHPREQDEGVSFAPGTFVPIAFSVWDGTNAERGNRRGLTSWYHVYVEPLERQSALLPMARAAAIVLVLELVVVGLVRRRSKRVEAVV